MVKNIKIFEFPLIYSPSGMSEYACPDGEMYVRAEKKVSSEIYYNPEDLEQVKVEPGLLLTVAHNGSWRHIYYEGGLLKWGDGSGSGKSNISLMAGDALGDVHGAVHVGEFVLLATSRGRRWLRCLTTGFKDLGSHLPSLQITYNTVARSVSDYFPLGVGWPSTTLVMTLESGDIETVNRMLAGGNGRFKGSLSEKSRNEIDGNIRGMVDDFVKKVTDRRLYLGPVNISYALRFYDGSHGVWSSPVRINPTGTDGVAQGVIITDYEITGNILRTSVEIRSLPVTIMAEVNSIDSLAQWEGIIEGVDFFITPEIPIWNTAQEVSGVTSINKQKAWNVGRYDSNVLTRSLQETSEYRMLNQVSFSSILSAYSQKIPISFEGKVALKTDETPEFIQSNLIPDGVGKVSSSPVVWGKLTPTTEDGVRQLCLEIAPAGNPFIWHTDRRHTPDVGEILGILPAVKSLSSGQLGEFPAYLFAMTGVWALRVDSSGRIAATQPICSYIPLSAKNITAIAEGVAFVASRGIIYLKGSSVTILSDTLEKSVTGAKMDIPFLQGCTLTADKDEERIFVEHGDTIYCYDFRTAKWLKPESMAVKPGIWLPDSLTPDRYPELFYGEGTGNSGGTAGESGSIRLPGDEADEDTHSSSRETRTLKLGGASRRKRVLTVDVIAEGVAGADEKVRLYGADLPGVWHLLGVGTGRRLGALIGSPRRFHKVAFEGFSTPPIALIIKVQQ